MARYVSRVNPVSPVCLKRKPKGALVVLHWSCGEVSFTRVTGGWKREDSVCTEEVVTSAAVAAECNKAVGCMDSWARVY